MAVLLKNLLARAPRIEDEVAINELIAASNIAEYGIANSMMDELTFNLRRSGFNPATDAWVIVTNKGQLVGFTCVWHEDFEQISTFVCVHPEYRNRGIGTLLLRLVEERARQLGRNARPGTRITLNANVSSVNEQAKRLFEREGYTPVGQFWRVVVEIDEALDKGSRHSKLMADLDVESQRLKGATQLYDRDGIYVIQQYFIYEKELRAGDGPHTGTGDDLKELITVG